MPQKFPLGDCIVQQCCIMEGEPFADKQVGHRCDAARCVRRCRVSVIDRAISVEDVLILGTRAIVVGNDFQMALDCSGASEGGFARTVRTGSLHRRRAKQEYSHAQPSDAGDRDRAGRESMAEEKRHVSQIADNLPEHLQYRFSGGRSKGKTDSNGTLGNLRCGLRDPTDWDVAGSGYSPDRVPCQSTRRRSVDRYTAAFVLQFYRLAQVAHRSAWQGLSRLCPD